MTSYELYPIGIICNDEEGTFLQLNHEYVPGLQALEGFSHINVLWWFSDFDNKESRSYLVTNEPYQHAPKEMGIFATRSPIRPNPIALTAVEVLYIDYEKGIVRIAYIDANDQTPILDIKPYTPSLDRVASPEVPDWCKDWPKSLEESADFPWETVFNF